MLVICISRLLKCNEDLDIQSPKTVKISLADIGDK